MNDTIILILIVIVAALVFITFRQLDKIQELEDKLNESDPIFLPLDVRIKMIEDHFTIRRLQATVNRLNNNKKQKK
jgi:hypothetical protein